MSGRLKDRVEGEANRLLQERIGRLRRALDEALAAAASPIDFPLTPGEWGAAQGTGDLHVVRDAVEAMARGESQREVLTALLDAAATFYPRTALFVVKAGTIAGWAGLGFLGEGGFRSDDVRKVALPAAGPHLLARAAASGALAVGGAQGPGNDLVRALGGVRPRESAAVPILVRGRAAAILYGDTGSGQNAGVPLGLEIAARIAGLAFERLGGERGRPLGANGAQGSPRPGAPTPPEEAEVQALLGDLDSFPRRVSGDDGLSDEDRRRLGDLRRFARLLVSELLLYNEEAVIQGRKHHDIGTRLRKEIDRSRQAYQARAPARGSAGADFFDEELVRVLAEGDRGLLGE